MDLITEIAIIFIAAGVLAYLAKLLKQPILAAYIGAGLIVAGIRFTNNGLIEQISTLGIAFLLFIVGLEIDIKKLRDVGLVSTIGGFILTTFLFAVGSLIAIWMGLATLEAVYVGLFLAFSSTMVVIKILSDRGELDTLHGRIVLGILLMQDFIAIIALFVLTTVGGFAWISLVRTLAVFLAIIALTYIASIYIYPEIFKYAAKSEELLFVTSTALCLMYIGIFEYLNLSVAIGAFIAGVTLANLPYNLEIIAEIKPLRDFFAVIFFVSLGMQLKIAQLNNYIWLMIILLALTILLKPLFVMIITSYFGYKKKPAFMSALSLAQASEFGLIVFTLGLSLGHIQQDLFSSVVLVTLISMAITSYVFEYEQKIYRWLSKYLNIFEKFSDTGQLEYLPEKIKKDVILCGYNRLGYDIFRTLQRQKKNFIVVDYNPEVIRELVSKKIPCLYGDIGDTEILNRLDLKDANMIISTVPEKEDSAMVIRKTKSVNKKAVIMVTALHVKDALELYKMGADYVIMPHFLGGERMSLFLEEMKGDFKKILNYKVKHVKELKHRHSLGNKHPSNKNNSE